MIDGQIVLMKLKNTIPIDLSKISDEVEYFYFYVGMTDEDKDPNENLKNLSKARARLDDARRLIRNLIDPSNNAFIANYPKEYNQMDEDIGRADRRIDSLMDGMNEVKFGSQITKTTNPFVLAEYIRHLEGQMNGFVLQPLEFCFFSCNLLTHLASILSREEFLQHLGYFLLCQ